MQPSKHPLVSHNLRLLRQLVYSGEPCVFLQFRNCSPLYYPCPLLGLYERFWSLFMLLNLMELGVPPWLVFFLIFSGFHVCAATFAITYSLLYFPWLVVYHHNVDNNIPLGDTSRVLQYSTNPNNCRKWSGECTLLSVSYEWVSREPCNQTVSYTLCHG